MALVAAMEVCKHYCCAFFFFFLQFYCFSKDIGFHKKNEDQTKREQKSPFHTIARTKANKKSCSDLLECEYHLNKLKVGKV